MKTGDYHRVTYDGGFRVQKKVKFTDYLTDLEGSDCEILDDYDWNLMPFKWRKSVGVDLDQFKADCRRIDND